LDGDRNRESLEQPTGTGSSHLRPDAKSVVESAGAAGDSSLSERSAMEGTMIWFNPEKRHGFIRTDEGERLRVDETGFEAGHALGDRCRGTRVSFDRSLVELDEARAVNVAVVPLAAERRARLRGRR
jgi:cold shock CspA family protein